MKKWIAAFLIALSILPLTGCGDNTVHCDRCGAEIALEKGSKIKEDWIVFCKDCETPVVSPN